MMRRRHAAMTLALATALFAIGCESGGTSSGPAMIEATDDMRKLDVSSSAFRQGGSIPEVHSCEGEESSPPLSWTGVPPKVESFIVLVTDPDAPGGVFKHWAAYDISGSATELPEGAASKASEIGFKQAKNDFGDVGYGAVCPPPSHDAHEYQFQVAGLDVESIDDFEETPRHAEVVEAAKAHVIATGTLTGEYDR